MFVFEILRRGPGLPDQNIAHQIPLLMKAPNATSCLHFSKESGGGMVVTVPLLQTFASINTDS